MLSRLIILQRKLTFLQQISIKQNNIKTMVNIFRLANGIQEHGTTTSLSCKHEPVTHNHTGRAAVKES